ncbi:MAG: protein translocase subunit SecF [Myxococcota bacterium]
MKIMQSETQIDFVAQTRVFAVLSLAFVLLSLLLMLTREWNLGIDFAGGTVLQVQIPEEAGQIEEGRLRAAVAAIGHPDAAIVRFGPVEDRAFRISLPVSQEEVRDLSVEVLEGLSKELGAPVVEQRIESIGPRVGQELRAAGLKALLLSWVLILIYVWFRFDLRYAPGAVAALIHDVLITAGVFVAFGLEFNLQVLAALLVVVGYSLNDTIVIYDRIRENLETRGKTHLEDVVNQSINQTLSRTLLTSLTTLMVVVALLVFGGPVVWDFALALLIGVSVGTYSTIYVASTLLILLERRFGPRAKAAVRA